MLVVLTSVAVLALETFSIQVLKQEEHQVKTKNLVTRTKNIYAERGLIMDRNGVVFADNFRDTANKNLGYSRLFLQGSLASQTIGKVGFNGSGVMGLESKFDTLLRGNEGFRVSVRDARSHEVYGLSENVAEAVPGKNMVLTIDRDMQEIVEKSLKDGVEEYKAKSASAIVMNPFTGEILSMASYPTFNPNSKHIGDTLYNSDIVSLSYEPGSTFKVITASAALEYDVVKPSRVFKNEGRCWNFSARSEKICDTHEYGDMDMSEAMVQSSNIVFAKIAQEVGAENMYRMARNFGFGSMTTDVFNGEEKGKIFQDYELKKDDRTLKTMGFGHSVMVTPLQMAIAYSAIANGGYLMVPKIVREWRDAEGNTVSKFAPDTVRQVISAKTAATIRKMLAKVVNGDSVKNDDGTMSLKRGTAWPVVSERLKDVVFGGKTGTAEKFNRETKKYDKEHQIASFVGLAPVEDPHFVCMVLVDDPQAKHVGGLTAGPIFRRIMEGVYFHPRLSPYYHNLAQLENRSECDVDFRGRSAEAAKMLSKEKKCSVRFEGKGSRVISERRDVSGFSGVVLVLGDVNGAKMPDLKGLSLKDALDVMSNIRMNVEYTGKGRVVSQTPKADEAFQKGQVCHLTLKEKG
ncbi:MAG: transpeptidase family protein [Fibrobacteraceae bacterium]|nr:transpeptidase family protein [Fibrobacteraceae bacterium]